MKTFQRRIKAAVSALTASAMLFSTALLFPEQSALAADTCVIDASTEYQNIRGFGGINHPEWTGQDLTDDQRQTAFGNGPGELGLTVLRVFVNPDKNQWYKAVPTAKAASDMGVTVFASPWEPPSNLAESGGGNGKLHLPRSNYAAYAQHLNDFGTYMKDNGVDLYSISVQNEPDYAKEWTYWSSDETTDFLANFADQITSTRVMSPESFQYSPENASWILGGQDGGKKYYSKILNNQKAMENCDLFGTHFYGTTRDWMNFPALETSGKEIWMTEVYVPNSDANSNERWPEALQVAENIHNGLVVGNMSAYVWWYIRRSYGPMNENGSISKRGYMMAQYSKYVRPGDVRISATESPADNLLISAYKGSDSQITIVAINKGSSDVAQNFSFKSGTITDVDRYRSTGSENLAVTNNLENDGSAFWANLPAESVSTFVVTMADGSITLPDPPSDTPSAPQPNEYGWFFHDEFEGDTCTWEGRGAATIMTSGRTAYVGSEALLVQNRESAWNGAYRTLNPLAFVPGEAFSFSANVTYFDGEDTEDFYLKLQYTGSDGEPHYSTIAEGTGVKGEWLQLANTNYTIPADATNMQLYVETASGTQNFYIDEAIGALGGTSIIGAGQPEIPTTTEPPTEPPVVDYLLGDVTNDGKINGFDLAALKMGNKNGFLNDVAALAADVNQNGKTDDDDVAQLTDYLLGRIDSFTSKGTSDNTSTVEVSMAAYTAQVQARMVEKEPEAERTEQAGRAYGTLQKVSYYSNTCKRNRNFNILLPAGYSTDKKYPVLYAMHGYWQNEDTLSSEEDESMRLRQIIGNAIAAGEAEDMIVVYPYIYASDTQDACSAMDDANNAAYDNFINELKNDLMPYIEANYSVLTGKDNTALTGFSMGGRESLYISNKMPDTFGYVGAICPAPGVSPGLIAEADFQYKNGSPYLLLLTAGSNDTVVYDAPAGYHNILTQNGVPHIWHYVDGGYHGGNCIRAHMYNFVRAAFKAK